MHALDVRIYYEDTDAGGVVYHSNYLKYLERGRTEAMRTLGFDNSSLARDEDVIFALARTDVQYKRPAVLDDLLTIKSKLLSIQGAKMLFKQCIYRDDVLMVDADITLVCINKAGQPKRLPKKVRVCFEQELENE